MNTAATQTLSGDLTPPYLPFATFQSAIDNLRTHGLPDPIDKTTWDSRSGSDQIQIFASLRFLGLLGEGDRPTPVLRSLVDTKPNTAEEKTIVRELIEKGYDALLQQLDLATATPGQLEDAMGGYQLKGSGRDRAIRFFLKAASYGGITLSSRLTRNMRDRASGTSPVSSTDSESGALAQQVPARKRRRRTNGTSSSSSNPQSPITEPAVGNAMKTVSLPAVKGTLTISGTFNAFGLAGEERKLVYDIIDMMNAFEAKREAESEKGK